MTLDQWAIYYAQVEALRLEALASYLAVVHSANPRRTHEQLIRGARKAASAGRERPLAADPARLRRIVRTIPGVDVVDAPKTPEPEPDADGR